MSDATIKPTVAERPAAREERVSTVAGHRLCAACGFTLFGQPILREPHYQMLIIRCPECGGIAAVQEYPALGRWAGRWAGLLAAMWLVVLFISVVLSAGGLFGMSQALLEQSVDRYALKIAEAHQAWYAGLADPTTAQVHQYAASQAAGTAPTGYTFVDQQWWAGTAAWTDAKGKAHPAVQGVDRAALLASAGGRWGAMDRGALWFLWVVALVGLVIGLYWSAALMAVRRSRTLWVLGVVGLIAAGFGWLSYAATDQWSWFGGGVTYARFLATAELEPFAVTIGLGVGLAGALAGAWCGRRVVRGCARILLPPSFRPALAILWTCDGLPPPSARVR